MNIHSLTIFLQSTKLSVPICTDLRRHILASTFDTRQVQAVSIAHLGEGAGSEHDWRDEGECPPPQGVGKVRSLVSAYRSMPTGLVLAFSVAKEAYVSLKSKC